MIKQPVVLASETPDRLGGVYRNPDRLELSEFMFLGYEVPTQTHSLYLPPQIIQAPQGPQSTYVSIHIIIINLIYLFMKIQK